MCTGKPFKYKIPSRSRLESILNSNIRVRNNGIYYYDIWSKWMIKGKKQMKRNISTTSE